MGPIISADNSPVIEGGVVVDNRTDLRIDVSFVEYGQDNRPEYTVLVGGRKLVHVDNSPKEGPLYPFIFVGSLRMQFDLRKEDGLLCITETDEFDVLKVYTNPKLESVCLPVYFHLPSVSPPTREEAQAKIDLLLQDFPLFDCAVFAFNRHGVAVCGQEYESKEAKEMKDRNRRKKPALLFYASPDQERMQRVEHDDNHGERPRNGSFKFVALDSTISFRNEARVFLDGGYSGEVVLNWEPAETVMLRWLRG